MLVLYPQVGRERQFKTEEYYLVTLEHPCKFRIHKLDKNDRSKQKSIVMNMSFLCGKICSLPWLFWIIGELKKEEGLQRPVDHNSRPDFLCLSESVVERSFPVLGKLGFCLFYNNSAF